MREMLRAMFLSGLLLAAASAHAADAASAERGKQHFEAICSHCHNTTAETSVVGAPGLKGIAKRRTPVWINNWLKSPEAFAKQDEEAGKLVKGNKYGLTMPTIPEMQDAGKRADVIEYLKTL